MDRMLNIVCRQIDSLENPGFIRKLRMKDYGQCPLLPRLKILSPRKDCLDTGRRMNIPDDQDFISYI